MILQNLADCYDLLAGDEETEIARPGYTAVGVSFALVIDKEGKLISVLDLRDGKRPRTLLVFEQKGRNAVYPYFLCDNAKYLLGGEYDKSAKTVNTVGRNQVTLEASAEEHRKRLEGLDDAGAKAVLAFFQRRLAGEVLDLDATHPFWQSGFAVFRLDGERGYIHKRPAIVDVWESRTIGESDIKGQCLITGKDNASIARLHFQIKGVMGANPTGATIVGSELKSVISYNRAKGEGAPVSEGAMFRYTTALNHLLADKRNHLVLGDTTLVFWAENKINGVEAEMMRFVFTGQAQTNEAERDLTTEEQMMDLLKRAKKGMPLRTEMVEVDPGTRTYMLGLAPNAARLSVRFWYVDTFQHFVENAASYYEDMRIVKPEKAREYVSQYDILRTLAVQGKAENVPKTVQGALFNAVVHGTLLPSAIYRLILMRVRAEAGDDFGINHVRAAYIKAYLNRVYRHLGKGEEYTVALNLDSKEPAYNLGRLFAILEKLQEDANGSSTIRARYFGAASSTPRVVFPTLLNLAQHHIEKADSGGYWDREISKVLANIDAFPAGLEAEDQGAFILGYYHQRQYIYTKKEDK